MNQQIVMKLFKSAEEAPDYKKMDPVPTTLHIKEVCVVENGTVKGKNSVDLVFVDQEGKVYVTMMTASMLGMIAGVSGGLT